MNPRIRWRSLLPALLIGLCTPAHSAAADDGKAGNTASEAIWTLEHAYCANLHKADYDGVLAVVHPQFLAWPGVDGTTKSQSSRITHIWVKEGAWWKLLGGMSYDKP